MLVKVLQCALRIGNVNVFVLELYVPLLHEVSRHGATLAMDSRRLGAQMATSAITCLGVYKKENVDFHTP